MLHGLLPLVLEICTVSVSAEPAKHPNLLLDRGEIERVKAKIARYPWAAAALAKTKEHALDGPPHENGFIDAALYYTFTGDRSFADRARGHLLECARSELPEDVHAVRFVPAEGTPAAPRTLTASVGVAMAIDRRLPLSAQYVVRAPGYTIKVDGYSGVSFYLLDAEGHRRHGRLYGGNFQFGIPSIEGASRWRTPAGFVWTGGHELTIGADPVRLHYTFHEDRMVFAITQPTDPTRSWTMWLGTFEGLGNPLHDGKQEQPWLPIVADRLFFPHPIYRQGVLLIPPPQAPVAYHAGLDGAVSFPIQTGQEAVLEFATKEQYDALRRSDKRSDR